jgi:hypothetical protein
MTTEEKTNKLRAAEALITQVRDVLNNEKSTCECCKISKYINWDEKQMYDQLNGAISRLQQVGSRINEPAKNDPNQQL